MALRVEFYGIARQRAGVSELALEIPAAGLRLADALQEVARRVPSFGPCITGGRLDRSLAANLGGARFVSDPETAIGDGECLLILSADGGG
jgi:molybdopterin converting factor small subunit